VRSISVYGLGERAKPFGLSPHSARLSRLMWQALGDRARQTARDRIRPRWMMPLT